MSHKHPQWLGSIVIFILATTVVQAQGDFPLEVVGYDSHSELQWQAPDGIPPAGYQVLRSDDGSTFDTLGITTDNYWLDFTGYPGAGNSFSYWYKVAALNGALQPMAVSGAVEVLVAPLSDSALLDMVQRYTFRYFWEFGHPVSGLARERNTSGDIVTMGGSGFGIMAMLVAAQRGWISREEARDRLLQIVGFLQFADRYHGVFPHWMNGANGNTIPFSQFDDGGDLVETAFLMQGLLAARSYFYEDNPLENALRQAITGLWEDVEWDWHSKNNSGVLYWHWSPNYGWQINHAIRGFNEAMIVYILAIASPTHPVPASYWNSGWAAQDYYHGLSYYGYPLATGPARGGPLFFAHYSFLGFDPQDKKDAFANYFTRNRNHSLINRAWCIDNPLGHAGYSAESWGLTASDDPWGYLAHEASFSRDNGTIAPTAALSSMPYTPAESLAALKHFYRELGGRLWGPMGFYDAFNIGQDWFAGSYLAIDQGPIIGMIENYRSGLLWNLFMANPEIQPALDAIGFTADLTPGREVLPPLKELLLAPNPATTSTTLSFDLDSAEKIQIELLDARGEVLSSPLPPTPFTAGKISIEISTAALPAGLYFLRLSAHAGVVVKKMIVNPG